MSSRLLTCLWHSSWRARGAYHIGSACHAANEVIPGTTWGAVWQIRGAARGTLKRAETKMAPAVNCSLTVGCRKQPACQLAGRQAMWLLILSPHEPTFHCFTAIFILPLLQCLLVTAAGLDDFTGVRVLVNLGIRNIWLIFGYHRKVLSLVLNGFLGW